MKIIKNIPIKMTPPVFHDKSVYGEHLEKMPIFSLLNEYSAVGLIGRAGSGKTSFLLGMLQKEPKIFRKCVDLILVVQPPHSRASIKKGNILSKLPEDRFYDELDEITMEAIRERIKEEASEGRKTLLILDDVTSYLKKNQRLETSMKDLIFNRRHYRLSIFITAQVYSSIPFSIRKSLSGIFLFYRPSKKEQEQVFEEQLDKPPEVAQAVAHYTYQKQYSFIFIHGDSQRVFSNWDEVVFD